MVSGNTIAEIAALIGDVSRANILSALMSGRALTAGELAHCAGVSAATTSGHLAKLVDGHLLVLEKQGRHRYYRLASPEVARAMEALMSATGIGPRRHQPVGPKDNALRIARTCYDHLAGRLAVSLADHLCGCGYIEIADGAGMLTSTGVRFLNEFGIDLEAGANTQRPLCRTCLDWSERRPHFAGRLGAGFLKHFVALKWIAPVRDSRAVNITSLGRRGLSEVFQISIAALEEAT